MSWSDDIRCLYCDGKLPLYRKITSGQFCNSAHRKAYWQEQERLAVERLSQTHDSLRAYRPPAAVEAIPGRVPEPAPYFDTVPESGHLPLPRLLPSAEMPPGLVAADPLAYDMDEGAWHPHHVDWTPKINIDDRIPMTGLMRGWTRPLPRWMVERLAMEPLPLNVTRAPIRPMPAFAAGAQLRNADVVELRFAGEIAASFFIAGTVEPVETRTAPVWRLSLSIPPPSDELRALLDEQAPQCERFFTLARPLACATPGPRVEVARQPLPIAIPMRPQIPLDAAALHAQLAPATLVQPGLRALAVDLIPRVQGAWIDSLRAVDPQLESDTPQFALTTPARRPRLQLAAGSRFAVRTRTAPAPIAESTTETFTAPPADVSMPQRNARTIQAQAAQPAATEMPVPSPRGLLPLPCLAPVNDLLAAQAALSIPQPPRTEMMRPASKLEPLDEKPVSDFMPAPAMPAPATTNVLFGMPEPPVKPEHRVHVWTHAIDFWKNAPRDLKMLAFAIPVLLGLALHPSLPKVRVAAPAATGGVQRQVGHALNTQWLNVRQSMRDRAGVALDEDFRAGLDEWVSRGDATTEWSFDATGFVRPGPLALYRPSLGLSDYQMQFLGLIDKKAMSWVVRAADFNNYHVVKLVVLKSGPLPTIGVTRYAVVDGKADARVDTIAPIDARPDMLYRVRMDAHGENFSLAIQGQMVDSWSEPRLRHGGVGFFSARGEESRVRWVQVTHQYDMLGRLCAYLAPYNISSTNGSWQP